MIIFSDDFLRNILLVLLHDCFKLYFESETFQSKGDPFIQDPCIIYNLNTIL